MSKLTLTTIPTIAPGFRLQWEEAQQAYVLLYPEGMITLNPSAGMILKYCWGNDPIDHIVATLQQQFPDVELAEDVLTFLEDAYERGWIRIKNTTQTTMATC